MQTTELCENRTKAELDRALRILLEQKPLERVRIQELTTRCAIRRQSFYYHFPDAYALFQWSQEQEQERLLARQENCITWQEILQDLLENIAQNRGYYQAVMASRETGGLRALLNCVLTPPLEKAQAYYKSRCGETQEQNVRQQWEGRKELFLMVVESWIRNEEGVSAKELVSLLEDVVWRSALGSAWMHCPLD